MINIKDLVENKAKYLEGFKNKGLDLEKQVDEVIKLQNELSPLFQKESDVRAELNKIYQISISKRTVRRWLKSVGITASNSLDAERNFSGHFVYDEEYMKV